MARAIKPEDLKKLRKLESSLKIAVRSTDHINAEKHIKEIHQLLEPYPNHHRLLECKLWYFECLLDSNHVSNAESGFISIRRNASDNTRLYLEASFFLSICYLRNKKTIDAKVLLKRVLEELNKIQSDSTRRLLQKRIIERVEEESILTELVGIEEGVLNSDKIHQEAIKLVQKSDGEILELLARALPPRSMLLLQGMRNDAILLLPSGDRKFLPTMSASSCEQSVGRKVLAVLKRIGWNTLCASDSTLYKLWSKKTPEIYSTTYFATAITNSFLNWRIGIPLLAAGVTALTFKYSAKEFCEISKPESIMETRRKSDKAE